MSIFLMLPCIVLIMCNDEPKGSPCNAIINIIITLHRVLDVLDVFFVLALLFFLG